MERVAFTDGDRFGVFDGEKTTLYESEYIARCRAYAETRQKRDEWKYSGEGARFRGDYDRSRAQREEIDACINSVQPDGDAVAYTFTVDRSSGVYRKSLSDPKAREEHILTSSEEEFLSLCGGGGEYLVTVKRDGATSSVGLLRAENSELKTLTEGDSRDANPCFCPTRPSAVWFESAGVGRTADGTFTGEYAPAAILSLDLRTMEIEERLCDKKYAYVKPKFAQNGDLYCIKRPNGKRRGGAVFSDIVLFPFRILKAIFGFLQAFVSIFGHTSLTSETSEGDNPARGKKTDRRELWIDGSLIEADREYKRNLRAKDKECGFIPMSWKLVRVSDGKEETVRSGVCDFALCRDGGLYCTNGRHIHYVKDGSARKIADTGCCLCVATDCAPAGGDEPFSL